MNQQITAKRKAFSAGYLSLVYSYRAKYKGLLAPFFLSSLEMLSNELMILSSMFSCGFSELIGAELGKVLL